MIRLLPTVVGTIFATIVGWFIAMVIGAAVSGVSGDFLSDLRAYEGVIGAVSGAIAGGCLAYQGKHAKRYGLGLFTRVALVGSGFPLLRLAVYQSHWPTAMVFLFLGSSLFLTGCFLILDLALGIERLAKQMPRLASLVGQVHKMGAIPLMTYAPLGLAMILLGAYATGGINLNCHRLESKQQIDCELEESRWLGLAKQETHLQDLQGSRNEFGDTVLITRSDEITIVGGIVNDAFVIEHAFQTFLASTKPMLRVSVEPRWIFFGISLVAGVLVWQGFSSGPITARPETDRWRRTRRIIQSFESPALIFGLVSCLWGSSFFLLIVPATQAHITEEENTPLLSSTSMLANLPDGSRVFVEGHISENNEVILHDFVMYNVAHYVSAEWQPYPVKNMTPPFWLDLPGEGGAIDRRLRVSNDTYGIDMTYDPPLEWYPDEEIDGETLRYRGYGRGDFVTIEGQIEQVAGEPHLLAWVVYSETVEKIVQGSRAGLKRAMIGGGIFSATGLILIAVFIYNLVTKLRFS